MMVWIHTDHCKKKQLSISGTLRAITYQDSSAYSEYNLPILGEAGETGRRDKQPQHLVGNTCWPVIAT